MQSPSTVPAALPVSLSPSRPSRQPYHPQNRRRILCISPVYTRSFGTFHHAFPLAKVKAFMPPQGILVLAAYLPKEWEVHFVDENVRPATDAEYQWADAVLITGQIANVISDTLFFLLDNLFVRLRG